MNKIGILSLYFYSVSHISANYNLPFQMESLQDSFEILDYDSTNQTFLATLAKELKLKAKRGSWYFVLDLVCTLHSCHVSWTDSKSWKLP